MGKKKLSKNNSWTVLTGVLGIIGVVIFVAWVFFSRKDNTEVVSSTKETFAPTITQPTNLVENRPTPTKYPYQIDEDNDGIFTNYEFGFRFNYPKDIFDAYTPGFRTILEKTTPSEHPLIPGNSIISLFPWGHTEEYAHNDFEAMITKNNSETLYSESYLTALGGRENWPKSNLMKVKDISIGDIPGFLATTYSIGTDIEGHFGYTAQWLHKGNVIDVTLIAWNESYDQELRMIIEEIIDSIEFFLPQEL